MGTLQGPGQQCTLPEHLGTGLVSRLSSGTCELSAASQAGLLALTAPLTATHTVYEATGTLALTPRNWRDHASMRATTWLCPNCDKVVDRAEDTCPQCGSRHSDIVPYGSAALVAAVAEDASATSSGRRLWPSLSNPAP